MKKAIRAAIWALAAAALLVGVGDAFAGDGGDDGGAMAEGTFSPPSGKATDRVGQLLTPQAEKPAGGVLVGLRRGIVGVTGSPVDGYVLFVATDFDPRAVLEDARDGLSAEEASLLTAEPSNVDSAALAAAWQRVADLSPQLMRIGSYTVDIEPQSGSVVLNIGGDVKSTDARKVLAQLPGLVLVTKDPDGGFHRTAGKVRHRLWLAPQPRPWPY